MGITTIHKIVAAKLKEEHTDYWTSLGWTIENGGKLIIAHLDDNCYNCNKSYLMWIPRKLNGWSRTDIAYAPYGKGFRAMLRAGKNIATDTYVL